MLRFVLSALVAAMPASAADYQGGEALQSEVQRKCADGCIVMNEDEVRGFEQALAAMVAEREQAARKLGELSCRNAI